MRAFWASIMRLSLNITVTMFVLDPSRVRRHLSLSLPPSSEALWPCTCRSSVAAPLVSFLGARPSSEWYIRGGKTNFLAFSPACCRGDGCACDDTGYHDRRKGLSQPQPYVSGMMMGVPDFRSQQAFTLGIREVTESCTYSKQHTNVTHAKAGRSPRQGYLEVVCANTDRIYRAQKLGSNPVANGGSPAIMLPQGRAHCEHNGRGKQNDEGSSDCTIRCKNIIHASEDLSSYRPLLESSIVSIYLTLPFAFNYSIIEPPEVEPRDLCPLPLRRKSICPRRCPFHDLGRA